MKIQCTDVFILQEGEQKKEGEEEEKEQEKLGKLEFSLDYNFTDTQVCPVGKQNHFLFFFSDVYIDNRNLTNNRKL